MNPKLRLFLIVFAKQAVNAVLTNSALISLLGDWSKFGTRASWILIAKTTASVVAAREVMVWGPKILAWSQSTDDQQAKTAVSGK